MSSFKYAPRSNEAWAKREKGSTFEGFIKDQYMGFSPKKDNWIRFLPPTWDNPSHYGIDIWVHYSVGPENANVLCLYKMTGKPCPVCEAHAVAEAAGREDANNLKATRRVLVWVVNRKEEKDRKPQYWAQPQTVDKEVTKICRDRVTGQLYYIDHPDQGYDVTFDKDGEGMTTKYNGFQIARQASSVEDVYLDYALANPLPEILQWRSYDEVKDLFEGTAGPTTQLHPGQASHPIAEVPKPIATGPVVVPTPLPQPPPPQVNTVVLPPPAAQFCALEVEYQGNMFGCNYAPGHSGDHHYQRYLRQAQPQAPVVPPHVASPGNSGVVPQTTQSAADRAAGLRDRFKTGPR
jgi:hypothetical protein